GKNGATSPGYTLLVNTPRFPGAASSGDWAEPNDSRTTARDLQEVQGPQSWSGLTLHAGGNEDWFQFEITQPGQTGQYVRIDFVHRGGDLNLHCYPSGGGLLATSSGTADAGGISLAGLAQGIYYPRVSGATATTTSPAYTLSINAPM